MAYPTKDSFTFDHTAQPDYPTWTPAQTKTNMNARSEEMRVALNTLVNALNSTGTDNWIYQQIANAILGQIADNSLTDIKLTNSTGQIKERVATHIANNLKHAPDTIGTVGQLLAVNSDATGTEWKTVTDEAWQKISEQTLSVAVAQIDFASIPGDYKNFRIMFDAIKDSASISDLRLVLNDDVSTNYRFQRIVSQATSVTAIGAVANTNIALLYSLPASGQSFSFGTIEISNFDATKAKRINAEWYSENNTTSTDLFRQILGGIWANTSVVINKISLKASSGNIGIGSRFVLWGAK